MLKICITPLLIVCSLHVPKIIEFYICIQMLPGIISWLDFSWATLYIFSLLPHLSHRSQALNSLICADVSLRNYSLTDS